MVGARPAARPDGEPAAEHELHARGAQSAGRGLHGLEQVVELLGRRSIGIAASPTRETPSRRERVGRERCRRRSRIAAAADIHCARRCATTSCARSRRVRGRRPDPARGRPDDARRARAGRGARGGVRDRDGARWSRCSATTTTTRVTRDEVAAVLRDAGVTVLCREAIAIEIRGQEIGIVGTKGFVGGFEGAEIPDFGEPLLRPCSPRRRRRRTRSSAARGDRRLPRRIVLLHYAPMRDAPGRARGDLGVPRLEPPRRPDRRPHPDLVLHGHAHRGSPRARSARCRPSRRVGQDYRCASAQ